MEFQETEYEIVHWIRLAQDMGKWQPIVNKASDMNL
jgi:hypothetical protein